MDNTTLLVIGAIVVVAGIYFSKKKDSAPAEPAPVEAEPTPVEATPAPVEAEPAPAEVKPAKTRKGGKSKEAVEQAEA